METEGNRDHSVSERLNQLVDLSRMRDAGTISEEEFAELKAELLAAASEVDATDVETPADPEQTQWQQAKQIAADYPRVVGMGVGLAIVLIFVLIYVSRGEDAIPIGADPPPLGDTEGTPLPTDSLGIDFSDLPDMWNGVDQPPLVEGGIARSLESGPFDSFLYRFDDSAVLAGAYDPGDDAIYALMVRASLDHGDISNMYLHVCYLLHPFSQECIDAYWKEGLKGKELADFMQEDHFSTWSFLGNEWRVEIVDGVQTLRVVSPGATRVAS